MLGADQAEPRPYTACRETIVDPAVCRFGSRPSEADTFRTMEAGFVEGMDASHDVEPRRLRLGTDLRD